MPNTSVHGFTKASEALDFARSHPVALAFLDIALGRNNGLTLCRELLQIRPRTMWSS